MSRVGRGTAYKYHALASKYALVLLEQVREDELPDILSRNMAFKITGKVFNPDKLVRKDAVERVFRVSDSFAKATALLQSNLAKVADLFGFPKEFMPALEFIALLNLNRGLPELLELIELHRLELDVADIIAEHFGLNRYEMLDAVLKLASQGLLVVAFEDELHSCTIPAPILSHLISKPVDSKDSLLATLLNQSPKAQFTVDAFPQANTELLSLYLEAASQKGIKGVSLLLYGEPGSGKTELARALAEDCEKQLYEVRSVRLEDGKLTQELDARNTTKQRIQHFSALQTVLAGNPNAVLLVDECERLFIDADIHYSKESLHRLIEDSSVPTIWITNHVDELENSFIRRFKLVQEIPSPDSSVLKGIAKQSFQGLKLPEQTYKEVASIPNITPAIIGNAGHVAKIVAAKGQLAKGIIDEMIESTLQACRLWEDNLEYRQQLDFDPTLLNIKQGNEQLAQIRHAVKKGHSVRVLLCGPPGTGKTALAYHMAEQFDYAIKRVKCSDVLSKYVGDSEKNVAELFQQAHKDKQILLLDEVDSLLTSRDRLHNQHELQLVSELLTQLECFTQPLFAATNFDQSLDRAVLRRFDFKLECDYLTAEQAITLYKRVLSVKTLSADERDRLTALKYLTPGDFAILARRLNFDTSSNPRHSALLLLKDENQRKQPSSGIGFIR
ncbi:ATP-binding protein [Rheinheimera texasensis]|uniref:AAA family ATPase n=1 Tax=Rheinheimera texasensis TaxID=306205 RepID=UPI0032B25BD8